MNTEGTLRGTVMSIIPVNTWLLPYFPETPESSNYPAWTISTLMFWYLWFPLIFYFVQRSDDVELSRRIIKCYWIQFFVPIVLCGWFVVYEGLSLTSVLNYVRNIDIVNDLHYNISIIFACYVYYNFGKSINSCSCNRTDFIGRVLQVLCQDFQFS